MSNEPIRISLLGLGRAGNFHLQSLRMLDDARLVCVYDTDSERAAVIACKHHCVAADNAEEAIGRPEVDAVIVATPTDSHFEYVQQSLDAMKPVLAEKPLGRSLTQIDACFDKAHGSSTPLFVAFQRRFDPSFSALVKAVHQGELGKLKFLRSVSRDNPVPAQDYIRMSGGIFHDCMVHDLDMVVHIAGETPDYMSAFGSSFIDYIGECDDYDNVVATLVFPSGVTATIDINRQSVYGYDQRIEAFGEGGMLQADNHHATSVTQATGRGFTRPPVDYSFPTRYREAYLAELEFFLRCVRREAEVPITQADVRTNHRLASGLETAAREKRVVRFEST